jgi:lipopolysaccharide exporter
MKITGSSTSQYKLGNWRNFFHIALASTFARDTAILTAGTALAQAIGIMATPVQSRLYTPSDFGLVAVYTAVVTICATIITLRYERRIFLPDADNEARSLVILTLVLAVTLGGILTVSTTVLSETVRTLLGLQHLGVWFPVAILASIPTAIIVVMSYWFSRRSEYKIMASLRVAQTAISMALGILLGLLAVPNGLLYAQVVTVVLIMPIFMGLGYASLAHPISNDSLVLVAKMHYQAPVFQLPTELLNVFTIQLPFIIISLWFSSDATGQYRMAYTLLYLPSSLIGNAIAQVFFQRFSNVWPDVVAAKALLLRTWQMLAILGITPLIAVMLFGKPLFAWILGSAWSSSGIMATILAPMVFISFIHSPTSTTFIVMQMERKMLFFGIAMLIYRPLSFYIGKCFNSIYIGLAIFVVLEIIQMLVFQYVAVRQLNLAIKSAR